MHCEIYMTEIKSTIFRNIRKLKALKSTGTQRLNNCEYWVHPEHCKDKIRVSAQYH